MYKLIVILLSLTAAVARAEDVEIERARQVETLTLNLNEQTVRCLVGDYSSESLKISVPELKGITRFPQTTRGETAPCINAGSCLFGKTPDGRRLQPALILDPAKPTEDVEVTIVLKEELSISHEERRCDRSLREYVSATVRGLEFKHADGAYLGELDYETCLKMAGR